MMNVALLEHEGKPAREGSNAPSPQGAVSLGHKLDALRELALSLVKEIDEVKTTLAGVVGPRGAGLQEEVQRFEAEMIRDALKKTGGHQRRAARLLGVKVSTLNAKIKRYGIRAEEVVASASAPLQLVREGGTA
jgi:DNA-binding NtrC family response regulator